MACLFSVYPQLDVIKLFLLTFSFSSRDMYIFSQSHGTGRQRRVRVLVGDLLIPFCCKLGARGGSSFGKRTVGSERIRDAGERRRAGTEKNTV